MTWEMFLGQWWNVGQKLRCEAGSIPAAGWRALVRGGARSLHPLSRVDSGLFAQVRQLLALGRGS